MRVHHIGYLVDNIEAAAAEFAFLGYQIKNEVTQDSSREIYILFMESHGYLIELIQPYNEASPIYKLRKKHRNSPYHICYETDCFDSMLKKMVDSGAYILLQPPMSAPSIGGRQVAFLVSKEIGLIEILESVVLL